MCAEQKQLLIDESQRTERTHEFLQLAIPDNDRFRSRIGVVSLHPELVNQGSKAAGGPPPVVDLVARHAV